MLHDSQVITVYLEVKSKIMNLGRVLEGTPHPLQRENFETSMNMENGAGT